MTFDELVESWKDAPDEEEPPTKHEYGITVPVLGEYKVTDSEFELKREAHIEKYGYTVNIPGLEDVFKIGWYEEPTEEEMKTYKDGTMKRYNPRRYWEIHEEGQKKKEKYLSMLGSPTPALVRSAGTVMNLLDDVNDTLGTGAVLLRTAGFLGRRIGLKFLMGPAGWLLLAADIFGIAMSLQQAVATKIWKKNAMDEMSSINPFSKRSRAIRKNKLKRLRPSKGELIEMAQTTNQFFGVGLCLGPLVGLAQDAFFGTWRAIKGEKVKISFSLEFMKEKRVQAAFGVLNCAHILFIDFRTFEMEVYYKTMVALQLATQIVYPYIQEWNPIDQIEGIEYMEKEAPGVTRPLSLWAAEELNLDVEQFRNWAVPGSRYATFNDIYEQGIYWAGDTMMNICRRNRRSVDCLMSAQNAELFSRNILDVIEGRGATLRTDDPSYTFIKQTFRNGFQIPAGVTQAMIRGLEIDIMFRYRRNLGTNWKQMCWLAKYRRGFRLPFEVPLWWIYSGWHYFQRYPQEFLAYAGWAGIEWEWWGYRARHWQVGTEWDYSHFYMSESPVP